MAALPAKLCDVCTHPGACCHDFPLSMVFKTDDLEAVKAEWETRRNAPGIIAANGRMPFEVLRKDPTQPLGHWRFACPMLRDGRCSIYDDRPMPCRLYVPASDKLCVMYRPPEDTNVKPREARRTQVRSVGEEDRLSRDKAEHGRPVRNDELA